MPWRGRVTERDQRRLKAHQSDCQSNLKQDLSQELVLASGLSFYSAASRRACYRSSKAQKNIKDKISHSNTSSCIFKVTFSFVFVMGFKGLTKL